MNVSDAEPSRRWRPAPRAIHTRTMRGGVILDPVSKTYFALNTTAEVLWKALEHGGASEAELAALLVREFDVEVDVARIDVASLLAELDAIALIQRDAAG